MYPSSDIDAEAMTCPIRGSSSPRLHPLYRPVKRDEVIEPSAAFRRLQCCHEASGANPRGYVEHVRRVVPWLAASLVLVALWPAVCMSAESGPTTCQSAVFLPLPWGESTDTWGFVAAIGAALLTFIVLRRLLRRSSSDTG